MSVTAKFIADFSSFDQAVSKADVKLRDWQKSVLSVDKDLGRMSNAFSGGNILKEASLAAAAIDKIGGISKLTASEQARANATFTEAAAKLHAMGEAAPAAKFAALADQTKKLEPPLTLAQKAAGLLSSTFAQFTAANLASTAITKVTGAITGMVTEAIQGAGHILDLGNKTGLSTATIQRMAFVANQTGASLDSFTDSAFKLGVNLADGDSGVVAAVRSLGLSLSDIQRLNPSQQFETIIRSLGSVENQTERNRLGVELFGRNFANIAAAVGEGYDDIAKRATLSSDAQLEAIDRAADRWQQFKDNIRTSTASTIGDFLLERDAMIAVTEEAKKLGEELTASQFEMRVFARVQAQLAVQAPALFTESGKAIAVVTDLTRKENDLLKEQEKRITEAAAAAKRAAEELKRVLKEMSEFQSAEFQQFQAITAQGSRPNVLSTGAISNALPIPGLGGLDDVKFGSNLPPGIIDQFLGGQAGKRPNVPSIFGGVASQIGPSLLAAFQGGGSVFNSAAGTVGGAITSKIFGSDAMKASITNVFGKTVGGALGTILPGIGALAGPAITGITKLFGSLFGGEGRKTNKERDEFLKGIEGGAAGLRKMATDAGIADSQMKMLFDTKKTKVFEAAAKSVSEQLKTFADEQAADTARLTAAIEKYGFSIEELGPKLQAQKLTEVAKELIEDWRVLAGAGIDVAVVNEKMAESINGFLQTALSVGAEVPAAMRPILQSLADQGKLFDANGNAITDLQAAGVTFAETLTQGFDRVVQRLDALLQRLGMTASAILSLPNVDIGVSGGVPGRGDSFDNLPQEGYAGGTRGRYVDFGAGRAVTLHGRERVMRENEEAGGALADKLDDQTELLRDLPRQFALRMQNVAAFA